MASPLANLGSLWQRTSLVQRVVLVAVVLGMLGSGWMLYKYASQPKLALLFGGMDVEEASKMVDKIRDSGVAYEIRGGGTQIFVDETQVNALRAEMAKQGLLGTKKGGYTLLDEEKFGASPSSMEMRFKRAIEGELESTIQMIDGVAKAKVIIAKGDKTLFAGKDKPSSASVMITPKNGATLSPANVAAIVNLVSGAVDGLKAEQVVVCDSTGRPLTSPSTDKNNTYGKSSTFLEYKTQVDESYAKKAQDLLASVLGPGRSSVRVDATIETTAVDETEETNPDGKPEKETIKTITGGGGGTASQPAPHKESVTETIYNNGRKTTVKRTMMGVVKSKTVAVLVDLTPPKDAEGKASAAVITVKDVEDIVRNAIGVGPEDQIKVVNVPFASAQEVPQEAAEPEGMFDKATILEIAKKSSLGLMAIGAVLALKVLGGGSKKSKKDAPAGALAVSGAAGQLTAQGGVGHLLTAGSEGEMDSELLRAQITQALANNPEEVKRLFLSWVDSDKEAV